MTRRIWVVADDFGLSPAVNDGILELLAAGRLSGTGCMTLFPEWSREAKRLDKAMAGRAGIHLTLTDQIALTGPSTLAREGRLPKMGALLAGVATGKTAEGDIHAELDAQLDRFTGALGRLPAYIDGHQHVHFLPPVRRWLKKFVATTKSPLPWLRGAPVAKFSPQTPRTRILTVRALAAGFDVSMRAAGFAVMSPLAGFYDWSSGDAFAETIEHGVRKLPDHGVLMCHPGRVDQMLRDRDMLTDTRTVELAYLKSDAFAAALAAGDAVIA